MAAGMTPFFSRNVCAVVLAAIVFGLEIASASTLWYYWFQTSQTTSSLSARITSYNRVYYDLEGYKVESYNVNASTQTPTRYFNYARQGFSRLYTVMKLVQAFVLIALVTALVLAVILSLFLFDRVRNKVLFALGTNVTRLVVALFAVVVVISTIIAFLAFLGFTEAFRNDQANCNDGPCRRFVDTTRTTDAQGTTIVSEWGAGAGWYIDLACIPISILLLVVVIVNKFPLPIDSEASSGEAL